MKDKWDKIKFITELNYAEEDMARFDEYINLLVGQLNVKTKSQLYQVV